MQILAHRGFWKEAHQRNTPVAFENACSHGFGIETDVRDFGGTIVISHDPPNQDCMTLEQFIRSYGEFFKTSHLAINIKSDGLAREVKNCLMSFNFENYFVFDMSIPDSLAYARSNMPFLTRRSEFEPPSALEDRADGIWFDKLIDGFTDPAECLPVLKSGKTVALVSPELHGRDHEPAWHIWRNCLTGADGFAPDKLLICTDYPDKARTFFLEPGACR